jgi:acetolactate synthase-1/2/3 large subunit
VKTAAVDVLLAYLKAEGTRVVFGIPGGLLHPFFDAVERDPELALIVTKHEEGAAFMADGYARSSRRLAVCAGTSGPGATNLLTGVAVAFADGVPMLVITGQAASAALGKGAAQETSREDIDIVQMFQPVTKYSTMVTSAEALPHHLRRALRRSMSGRPGPAHLNVPVDLWKHQITEEWFDPESYRPASHSFDRSAVARAADLLMQARRPALLAGAGVADADASELILTMAELLPARVATTPRGKGVFPEDHPLSLGICGFAGHRAARETLLGGEVDVLLTVGASLNETTTFTWSPSLRPSRALLQVDIDPDRVGRNYPVDVPLVGDAQTILVELVYHMHRMIRDGARPNSVWRQQPPLPRGDQRCDHPELRLSEETPVSPRRWRRDLCEVLPEGALVFSDIGGHMLFNLHDLEIRRGQRFLINLGFGSMGYGTAAPLGAALSCPDRPVVAIVGDACFTMNGMELLTAAEHRIPVVWIVENNQMHGIVWHGSKLVGDGRPLGCVRYTRELMVADIARAMGLEAEVVDGPGQIQGAYLRALKLKGPYVIEVRSDPNLCPPLADRAQSISGFVGR